MSPDLAIITLRESVVADERSPSGLKRRERPSHHFASPDAQRSWNAKHAGAVAGAPDAVGVFVIVIGSYRVAAYRAVFALRHGRWPLDHGSRRVPLNLPPTPPA
jgi:hypothetical protein